MPAFPKFKTIITDYGKQRLIAAMSPGGTKLTLTQMAVGDGGGNPTNPDTTSTALVNEVWRTAVNSVTVDKKHPNIIIVELLIPAEVGGFWVREAGIYDEFNKLVAICSLPASEKPLLEQGSGRTQTVRMTLIVSDTSIVNITIDSTTIMATNEYVDNSLEEHEKSRNHPDATLTDKGFVQLSSATGSTDETKAATPKAVKAAMDNANKRQPGNENLTALSSLAGQPDKLPYFTNKGAMSLAEFAKFMRTMLSKTDAASVLEYLGLRETINLAKNAVPATRRVNSKPLTGDITLSAADVNAFALGMTGDYTLENDKSVGWNWKSGVYNVPTGGASSLILHFNMNIGSCPAVQFCVNYKNGGISYRSARDGFGFELDWTEFYTTTRKPSAGDVGALPVSGGVINGNLGIGTPNILGGSSIVFGDNDTGIKQNGDGLLDIYANGVQVFRFQNDTLESKKSINVTGRLTPTDYGNFDSRYVQDIRLGSLQYGQVWNGPGFSDTSGYVITGIINGNSDELVDGAHRRPIQKLIGNQWYNVVSI
ncbi:phage tail protein [Salmonella enterica subsp. enterica serovar Enteritidis]|uniref:Phage tail protein n=4 Tax=Salmonella enterica TaxID=28901 RepID=A0A719E2G8_SALTS|nr:phage tail protein [Salmonella enterica]EBX0036791.1 phage tail protein [Salmonella enterica subsp. enterica serovar Weltevreden]ECB2240963.1 phage tail protein [Salmonella enterica subsp. enterica serovar Typhimurium]HAD6491774.1 phage tail protein [Salmonella enterica subsp. enterica serovar Typhimurium str. SL1344]HCG4018322.1 phage tail protein [Salmonella enterica subsp. enterica serovar Typhi str. AG3]EBV3163004.1 phage tail protein [Salmonella enterica subsp. enterica serovar Enterit